MSGRSSPRSRERLSASAQCWRARSTVSTGGPLALLSPEATFRAKRPLVFSKEMKADIHPEYLLATVRCSCGNEFQTRSTRPELHVEVCSECHPFYTGKQKLMDAGGRVERFQRRLERAGRTGSADSA